SRLLARQNRDRLVIGEQPGRVARARRGVAPGLLCANHLGDVGATAIVSLRARDRVRPGRAIGRIAGKKRRNGAKIVRVIGRQTADPGEAANVDWDAHRGLVCDGGRVRGIDRHRESLLSQTVAETVNHVKLNAPSYLRSSRFTRTLPALCRAMFSGRSAFFIKLVQGHWVPCFALMTPSASASLQSSSSNSICRPNACISSLPRSRTSWPPTSRIR